MNYELHTSRAMSHIAKIVYVRQELLTKLSVGKIIYMIRTTYCQG